MRPSLRLAARSRLSLRARVRVEGAVGNAALKAVLAALRETARNGMIGISGGRRIFVAAPADRFQEGHGHHCRAGAGGAESRSICGDVFIFRPKRCDRLKILVWDGSGLILATKRAGRRSATGRAGKQQRGARHAPPRPRQAQQPLRGQRKRGRLVGSSRLAHQYRTAQRCTPATLAHRCHRAHRLGPDQKPSACRASALELENRARGSRAGLAAACFLRNKLDRTSCRQGWRAQERPQDGLARSSVSLSSVVWARSLRPCDNREGGERRFPLHA